MLAGDAESTGIRWGVAFVLLLLICMNSNVLNNFKFKYLLYSYCYIFVKQILYRFCHCTEVIYKTRLNGFKYILKQPTQEYVDDFI